METNCFGGPNKLASQFCQNNEFPQNISLYKFSNLFIIIYLCIYFLIFFPQSELLSPKKKNHNYACKFYFVHHVSK